MGEEIAVENGRISDFKGLVTLTLTLDRVVLHTFMRHSSISTYIPNFIEIEETFCGRMEGRTNVRTCGRTFETHFRSRPKTEKKRYGQTAVLQTTLHLQKVDASTSFYMPPVWEEGDDNKKGHMTNGMEII